MKFAFYSSLKESAKRAIWLGTGKHGRYNVDIVDGKTYIAYINKKGNSENWILIVKGIGAPIKEVTK